MKTNAMACCHGERKSQRGWASGAAGAVPLALLAALAPKCPLCIAAWLGVLGLSGLATRVDPRALLFTGVLGMAAASAGIVHWILSRTTTKKGIET